MNPNQRGVPSQRSKRKLSEGKRPTWLYTVANSHGATLSFTGRPDETDLTTFLWKLEIRLKKACIADWESIKEFLVDVLGGPALEYLRINSEWWRRFLSTKKNIIEQATVILPTLYQKTRVQAFISEFKYWEDRVGSSVKCK